MKLKDLITNYKSGKMDKRLFWQLARERVLPLLELRDVLDENISISVNKNQNYIEKNGIKLIFDLSQTVCRAELLLFDTEQEDWDFLCHFITDNSVVFDIGANVGLFSITFKHKFSNAQIFAFEPVKDTFSFMQKNIALNNMNNMIQAYNVGVSNESGTTTFFVPPENEAASLRPVEDSFYLQEGNIGQQNVSSFQNEIKCEIIRLDDFTKEKSINKCDFIKIDVEGAELFALQGGVEFIKSTKPVIYCEMLRKHAKRFDYHPNDIIALMKTIGYCCYELENNKLKSFTNMTEDTVSTNFFFIHETKKDLYSHLIIS